MVPQRQSAAEGVVCRVGSEVKRSFVVRRGGLLRTDFLIGNLVNNNWTPYPLFFKSVHSKGSYTPFDRSPISPLFATLVKASAVRIFFADYE